VAVGLSDAVLVHPAWSTAWTLTTGFTAFTGTDRIPVGARLVAHTRRVYVTWIHNNHRASGELA